VPESVIACANCGSSVPGSALACPQCFQLTHAQELQDLAGRAKTAETEGRIGDAVLLWRQALDLLPPEAKQAEFIRDHIASLSASIRVNPQGAKGAPEWTKKFGPLGVVIAFLLKWKTAVLIALSKGKFLLLGLAKAKTILSMFAFFGVYWLAFGWKFALGFVIGIYIHEMGHVWMLRQYGLRASVPMFIPGFGALISLYDSPPNVSVDARIGLAGPLWGGAAGLAFAVPGLLGMGGIWFAIAHVTAYMNLFNLTPVWTLDGGRAFRALDRMQRIYILGLALILWALTRQGMFLLVAVGAAFRIFWQKDHAPEPDQGAFLEFGGLMLFFGAMLALIPQAYL
jgi:Zn-dependent protease